MKARTGSLVKRSSGYYCRIMVDGKLISRALHNPDNTPCKTLVEARKAQGEFTKPFTLANKAQALEAIQTRLSGIREAMADKPTVAGAWDAYLQHPDKLTSGLHTQNAYCQYTRDFAEWIGEHYPQAVYLSEVTRAIAGEYAAHLTGKYSNVTFNKHTMFLKVLFRVLCEDKPNPFERIRYKPIDSVSHKPLTPEQIQAVLGKAKGEMNTLVLIGVYCALRLGDACLLKWEQVDIDKGVITVKPHKTASRSGKVVSIPIHPDLKARLETLFRTGEYVLPKLSAVYARDRGLPARYVRSVFKRAGIKTMNDEGHTVYSFHSLRFTLGSALVSSGFTLEVVSQLLGHTNTTMSRHYSSIADTVKEKAILSLPSITTATA